MGGRDDRRVTASRDVLSRELDGEAVLLDLNSGDYFGLNEVGSEIWRLIGEGTTVKNLRERLQATFDADIETITRDLDDLLGRLAAKGLITVSEP